MDISFELIKTSDLYWQEVRSRHYIANKGTVGRLVAAVILVNGERCGIISAGASAWCNKLRDEFFGITATDNKTKGRQLCLVLNNSVFRLERTERLNDKNLGTKVLSRFRTFAEDVWLTKYGDRPVGWETYVGRSECRAGAVYKADNWTYLGDTKGTARSRPNMSSPGKITFTKTDPKMIFCKWSLDRKNSSRRRRKYFDCLPPVEVVEQGLLFEGVLRDESPLLDT